MCLPPIMLTSRLIDKGTNMSAELIKFLQNPALYNHPVEQFQVIETHISWVILTGPYAYKIKKPVDFGFLNFTQLADRKHFCEEELRLNQRLTHDLYLEVLPITGSVTKPQLAGQGEPIEYVLKMRQFPQHQLLSQLQARGELKAGQIDELASQIANFHQLTPKVALDLPFGSPEVVMAPVRQNFEQIRAMLPEDEAGLSQLAALEAWAEATYQRLQPLLAKRKAEGFVRECHGDIHLNNAAVLDGKVVLFDCIEFNQPFRLIDVANDIAFLVMDLEDRKLNALANRLLNNYLEQTGDYESLQLMSFYKAYRAMVRAKVALFSLTHVTEQSVQQAILSQYYNYANLAESYTFIPHRCLLITSGVSGVGKSYVALQVVERFAAIRVRSDVERKRLLGANTAKEQLYSAQATEQTYQRLYKLAKLSLQAGYITVLDAAYLKQAERMRALKLAEEQGVPFIIINCEAPLSVIGQHLEQRAMAAVDPSDATWQVVKQQLASKEPFSPAEKAVSCTIATDNEKSINILIDFINELL